MFDKSQIISIGIFALIIIALLFLAMPKLILSMIPGLDII